jgi:hypothetical protein
VLGAAGEVVAGGVVVLGGGGAVVVGGDVVGGTVVGGVPVTTGAVVVGAVRCVRGAFTAAGVGEPQAASSTNGKVAPTTANWEIWRLTMLHCYHLGGHEKPNSLRTLAGTAGVCDPLARHPT